MRLFLFTLSFLFTMALIYVLDNRWVVQSKPLPPIGRFLDPFHGFWQNVEAKDPDLSVETAIPGLKDSADVLFDSLMIPHIFARNDDDLYRIQGYVTAMHRLWQMEVQTHAAAGRLAEIVGPAVLDNDRYMRRIGMVYGAQRALDAMMQDPTARMMVEQYTEGINAYIASLDYEDLPFEYKLLHYRPEPWTPLKCALFLKNMEFTLCMREKDMEMSNALKLYGPEVVNLLYPDRDSDADPIVDAPGTWKFPSLLSDTLPMAVPAELIGVRKMPGSDPGTGSNNWAVHGSRSATGAPMLCNDPHLNLSLPSLWYIAQLQAPGINTMGASLPGSPAIIIGFTDSVAWGITNAQRDLVDWYAITFQGNKKEKYLLDGKWADVKKVVETIVVRGGEIQYDTVLYTHWGPIPYDESFRADNNRKGYAFRWAAHEPSRELIAFYKLNRARNYSDYAAALDFFSSPPQNFVFASAQGDVAMRIQGRFPARRKNEGKFVLDGSNTLNGWQAFIPAAQNVQQKNPPRGFVSSANQYPVDGTYPYYINAASYETYRNRRINQVLSAPRLFTVQDMMDLQNDNYNLKAAESLPVFLAMLDSAQLTLTEQQAWQTLKAWDYYHHKDSEGASYYEAWWSNLMPLVWDEMEKDNMALSQPTAYNTIKLIKEKPDLSFFDLQGTAEKETARDIVRKAFVLGVAEIEKWRTEKTDQVRNPAWGAYKDSRINHLLRMDPLGYAVLAGGTRDAVNAHSKTHGPSWRMVVSLEKTGVKAWGIYPGGQSGNPGSAAYANMITSWVEGKNNSLLFLHTPDKTNPAVRSRIHFTPEAK